MNNLELINQYEDTCKKVKLFLDLISNLCEKCKTNCCTFVKFNEEQVSEFISLKNIILNNYTVSNCQFSSKNGCILDVDYRPFVCLNCICGEAEKRIENVNEYFLLMDEIMKLRNDLGKIDDSFKIINKWS